ncbi:MAG: aminoacyl-tRNA hydrolase [Rhizobiales bacterium 17-65-6]|nr:MAG: aminoacyl-tRNA hydrolase [Rhizobiales bacterium 17-65-6]
MARIEITQRLWIEEDELSFTYVRASGPGGQNVNKVYTAAQLRFDAWGSPSLPDGVKARIGGVAGSRMTQDGVIVLHAQKYRSQERNREDAIARLADIIREAAYVAPTRRKTRPTLASKERRLAAKDRRGTVKTLRRGKPDMD